MERNTKLRTARVIAASALAIGMSSVAVGHGGGGGGGGGGGFSGGDSGDSSMNPFTGDSWAYFHGGHNLGEAGTIRPNRVPEPRAASQGRKAAPTAVAPADARAKARTPEPDPNASPDHSVSR